MKREFSCKKCGYRWKAEKARYCLNCHSDEVGKHSPSRRVFHGLNRRMSDRRENLGRWFSKRQEGAGNLMADLWHGSTTLIFTVAVFVALLVLLLFLSR